MLDTIWSSIIRIQHNTPEDGHIDGPKHVKLFIIINKLLLQVGISRQQNVFLVRTENHSLLQYTESIEQHTSETDLDEERVA